MLADRLAIADLALRYCRAIDRGDFAAVRALYHDDAVEEHGTMYRGDPGGFVAWLPTAMAPWDLTRHELSNSVVALDGDRAEGEHYVRAWHRTKAPDRQEVVVWGRYLDRYTRRDGVWRFARRSLVFDHGLVRPVDEGAVARLGADAPSGRLGPGDPSLDLTLL